VISPYTIAEDNSSGEPPGGGAALLGNGGFAYTPDAGWRIGGLLRYVGERDRTVEDTRENLDGYLVFDINGEIQVPKTKGLSFKWGVANLFDTDVRYPAEMIDDLTGTPIASFPDDYPVGERQWWMKLSWKF
jgi:outer membrane receptor for ferrienterochelin and colicin